jgi:hypothetical protein
MSDQIISNRYRIGQDYIGVAKLKSPCLKMSVKRFNLLNILYIYAIVDYCRIYTESFSFYCEYNFAVYV